MMNSDDWVSPGSRFAGLWRVRFYFIALAVQKGLPVAILPLIITLFGRSTFSYYALVFSAAQIFANGSSLAVPQAVIPLWFRQSDRALFLLRVYVLVLILWVIATISCAILAAVGSPRLPIPMSAIEIVLWAAAYGLAINLNQITLGVARAEDRQRAFFWASVLGGIVLLGGVGLTAALGMLGLRDLLLVQISSLAAASLVMACRHAEGEGWRPVTPGFWKAAREMLRFSMPLAGYSMFVLLSMSIDKWTASLAFPPHVFESYVIDFQAAFSIMFVPVAIGMYNAPRVSELVAAGDMAGAGAEERRARGITLMGGIGVAIAMFVYARVTGLGITPCYWLLVSGFLFEGQYIIKSNNLMAQMRSSQLMVSAATGVAVLAVILVIAAFAKSVWLLYSATPVYLGLMLVMISWRRGSHVGEK